MASPTLGGFKTAQDIPPILVQNIHAVLSKNDLIMFLVHILALDLLWELQEMPLVGDMFYTHDGEDLVTNVV